MHAPKGRALPDPDGSSSHHPFGMSFASEIQNQEEGIMSDKIVIDLAKAVEIVLELINEKPDGYKYRDNPLARPGTCANIVWSKEMSSPDGMKPGCIVGSAVIKLGVKPVEIFAKDAIFSGSYSLFHAFTDRFTFTTSAGRYLSHCQTEQDAGGSWAEAHSFALNSTLQNIYYLSPKDLAWLDAR
jgi:hypothetical protein